MPPRTGQGRRPAARRLAAWAGVPLPLALLAGLHLPGDSKGWKVVARQLASSPFPVDVFAKALAASSKAGPAGGLGRALASFGKNEHQRGVSVWAFDGVFAETRVLSPWRAEQCAEAARCLSPC